MDLLDGLIRRTGFVCRMGVLVSGALFMVVSLAIAVDVVLRKGFNISIVGTDEVSGFLLAISCSWGFAFALLNRAHIRIDTILLVLPKRVCAVLDILGLVMLGGFIGIVGWYGANVLALSFKLRANALMLDIPIWIPQSIWVAGFVMFAVLAVLLLLRAVMAFATGDLPTLNDLIGSRSALEDLEHDKRQVELYREGPP